MRRKVVCSTAFAAFALVLVWSLIAVVGCGQGQMQSIDPGPRSISGVKEVVPEIKVGVDGLTTEQRNIRDRYKLENLPGAIKHLYIISAYSGDVLIYSTVRGKVTSSGKRLSPTTVAAGYGNNNENTGGWSYGMPIKVGGVQRVTSELIQDDGTYGSSIEYLYWFSADGRYFQHYVTGGQIVTVSDQPIAVKKVILNLEHKSGDAK